MVPHTSECTNSKISVARVPLLLHEFLDCFPLQQTTHGSTLELPKFIPSAHPFFNFFKFSEFVCPLGLEHTYQMSEMTTFLTFPITTALTLTLPIDSTFNFVLFATVTPSLVLSHASYNQSFFMVMYAT